jgi:hypothetical protein
MICDQLTTLLGFDCFPLTEGGEIALVQTPFKFHDGDALPVFVEVLSNQVRFFDDGATLRHFLGRGVRVETKKHATFLSSHATKHGAAFTEAGEIEAWASLDKAGTAFSAFLSSLLALTAWEKDQEGMDTDMSVFVEEVAMALRAWKPDASIAFSPPFTGISGRAYKLNFLLDGRPVAVTSAHPNSVSALLHRLIDIHGLPINEGFQPLVIIDDRTDPRAADREASIMQNVSTVIPFSSLQAPQALPH